MECFLWHKVQFILPDLCHGVTKPRHCIIYTETKMETFSALLGLCHLWIPLTKARDMELWCFLWSAPYQMVEQTIDTPVIWDAIMLIMMSQWYNITGFTVSCHNGKCSSFHHWTYQPFPLDWIGLDLFEGRVVVKQIQSNPIQCKLLVRPVMKWWTWRRWRLVVVTLMIVTDITETKTLFDVTFVARMTTFGAASDENFVKWQHFDGLVQDCSKSIARALELLQSCTKPSIYGFSDETLLSCLQVTTQTSLGGTSVVSVDVPQTHRWIKIAINVIADPNTVPVIKDFTADICKKIGIVVLNYGTSPKLHTWFICYI